MPRPFWYQPLRRFYLRHRSRLDRLLEIVPGAMSWSVITAPLWLGYLYPDAVAFLVLLFMVYWFYRSTVFAVTAVLAWLRVNAHQEVDWLSLAQKHPDFQKLRHLVIIPTYKESLSHLERTLTHLAKQTFPTKRVLIALAFEKREGEAARRKAKVLESEFADKFGAFWITFHPDLPGEVKGKASNEAYAAKAAARKLKREGRRLDLITVTSCDADSVFHHRYFAYLSYLYLNDKERAYHFYWAPYLLYNNFWQLPLPTRVQVTIGTLGRLGLLLQRHRLLVISVYSLSLETLDTIGYWDTNIIPEDWHIFLQAFFYLGDKVETIPIFLPINGDAALSTSYLKSLKARYEQERRWAWGVTDIPYAIRQTCRHTEIPLWPRLRLFLYMLETHLTWSSHFFLLTLGATIPPLINPAFRYTALGHNLPRLAKFILTLASVFLIAIIALDIKSRPKRPTWFGLFKTPLLLLQYLLMPVISFFFASLPGLDAHTRLMLNRHLEYKVSEKA
jgi:hypothetical protein